MAERKLEIPTQNLRLANTLRSTISSAAEAASAQSIREAEDVMDRGVCATVQAPLSDPQPLLRSPQIIWLHFHKACL